MYYHASSIIVFVSSSQRKLSLHGSTIFLPHRLSATFLQLSTLHSFARHSTSIRWSWFAIAVVETGCGSAVMLMETRVSGVGTPSESGACLTGGERHRSTWAVGQILSGAERGHRIGDTCEACGGKGRNRQCQCCSGTTPSP